MTLSARNRPTGTVASVETSGLTAEVTIELGDGQEVTSVITTDSVERFGIEEGEEATAVIEATEVMIDA